MFLEVFVVVVLVKLPAPTTRYCSLYFAPQVTLLQLMVAEEEVMLPAAKPVGFAHAWMFRLEPLSVPLTAGLLLTTLTR